MNGSEINKAAEEDCLVGCFRLMLGEDPVHLWFTPKKILETPGAAKAFDKSRPMEMMRALYRHLTGDWGELDREDWDTNDRALKDGERLLSAHTLSTGTKFWIITDAGHEVTTFLLPEEY